MLMNTDCTRFYTTQYILFHHTTVHIFSSKCLSVVCHFQPNAPPIKFNVASYSVFGIIIIKFTLIFYPLFIKRIPLPFYCFCDVVFLLDDALNRRPKHVVLDKNQLCKIYIVGLFRNKSKTCYILRLAL